MSISAAELIARVSVQGAAAAEGQLLGVGKASDATEARFRSLAVVGSGLLVAGLVGVGIASVKMAGDFQQGVNRLRTGAGDAQDSFATLSKGILGVSVATGVMTGPLTQAMYLILSSGQRGAQAFDTLKVAAQGAVIEQAKVADVANVLSGIMTNYGTHVFGATQYMNGLIFAVAHGKISLQDLSVAMGPIDPIAKHLGISMADVAAAMTTQTNAMIPAARAATGLRFMMSALENPTHKAKVAMADLGLDSVKVAEEMTRSLPGALQMIVKAALKVGPEGSVPFNRAVGDMVGGIRGLSAFMGLTGTHMKDFIANSQGITAAMKNGAGGVQGWAIAQSNFNVQMDRAKASVAAAGIGLGLLLLPALTHLASLIPGIVQYFSDFSAHAGVLVPILAGIGAVIVGLLVPAVWSLAAGVIAATWPVLLIGAAIAGLVAIFMHFYSTNAGFKSFIDNLIAGFKMVAGIVIANFIPAMQAVGAWLQAHVLPILQQIGAFLASTFAPVWKQLVDMWNSSILPSLKQLWAALQPLLPVLLAIGGIILGVVVVAFGILVGLLAGLAKGIAGFLSGLIMAIGGIIQVFTGVVQVIVGIVRFLYDLLTGNFGALKGDLAQIWAGIVNIFAGAWKVIEGLFVAAWGFISGLVSGFVQGIIGFFTTLYNALVGHSIVPNMINGIITWFASLPGRVFSFVSGLVLGVINFFLSLAQRAIAAVQNLVSGVINWFSQLPGRALGAVAGLAGMLAGFFGNLAGQALSWGANIINNIAAGIQGAIGAVAGAIGNVANFIASHLPHSPAKLGPLRDLELQGAQIVAQLSKGMSGAMPALQGQLHLMLSPVVSPGSLSTPGLSASYALRSASGGQTIVINVAPPDVALDGQRLTRAQMPYIVNAIRANAPARF